MDMLQIVVSSENSALEDLCQTYPISSCLAGQTTAWDEIFIRMG